MSCSIAVIGVGNMAKAIISGIMKSSINIGEIILCDKNEEQYSSLLEEKFDKNCKIKKADSITAAIENSEVVLLSVKPQNFPEILAEISSAKDHEKKLYISIAAGITVQSVSDALNGANVVRVLPNIPMIIKQGVSVICRNPSVSMDKFELVCDIFRSSGSTVIINESEMNAMIGVTSSSPAYVFKFINAIYEGALVQNLGNNDGLLDAICDMVVGSALLLKQSGESPKELISKVASKGGTTERALEVLENNKFNETIIDAMKACTAKADELGKQKR